MKPESKWLVNQNYANTIQVDTKEIENLLYKLNLHKACGHDITKL
jgi:hypothetical protein